MSFFQDPIIVGFVDQLSTVWWSIWWIVTPVFLGMIFYSSWLFYIRTLYFTNLKWVMLRVRTPKEQLKTPKAMEQVFSAAYSTYTHGLRYSEIYWDGMLEPWSSFELVGYSGGVSFYIRCIDRYRNMFESAIYAQYPDAEIDVVEDYTNLLPAVVPNKIYDLWGSDVVLAKDDAYPIRTYVYWESQVEEEKVDTMATLLEVLSKLKDGEMVWWQILVRPTDDKWKKKAEKERDKLFNKEKKTKKKGFGSGLGEFVKNLVLLPFREPVWEGEKKPEEKLVLEKLTPGEREVIKAVEDKMSKLAFETDIRWLYIYRRDAFNPGTISSMTAVVRQFNTFNLNLFRLYKPTLTIGRQPFKRQRIYYKKRQLYDRYRLRIYPPRRKFSMLNIEELASVYHFPSQNVEAPMLRRVEAKKGEPPPGLPIE